jgi:hypothetical protein
VGISRDYPLKTRTSKQPIGEIPGFKIIPSHPLKYSRSKQGLVWREFVGISRNYPLPTQPSKQIPGYGIIPLFTSPVFSSPIDAGIRPCLLLWYFYPQKMWGYVGIWCSPNNLLSDPLKYPFPKKLHHDGEFLI